MSAGGSLGNITTKQDVAFLTSRKRAHGHGMSADTSVSNTFWDQDLSIPITGKMGLPNMNGKDLSNELMVIRSNILKYPVI